MSELNKLKFVVGGNNKLKPDDGESKQTIAIFNLPAGHTCPGACECKAKVKPGDVPELQHGPKQKFVCYAAGEELRHVGARELRWYNKDLLDIAASSRKPAEAMAGLILASLPPKVKRLRVHSSGDFFSQAYFDAWMIVATERPDILFYAYTKSLRYWVARLFSVPDNFYLTASKGGVFDYLIEQHALKYVEVVPHPDVAAAKGLEIDHDDTHAYMGHKSFALLMHGLVRAGSEQADAQKRMRDEGISFSYGAKSVTDLLAEAEDKIKLTK